MDFEARALAAAESARRRHAAEAARFEALVQRRELDRQAFFRRTVSGMDALPLICDQYDELYVGWWARRLGGDSAPESHELGDVSVATMIDSGHTGGGSGHKDDLGQAWAFKYSQVAWSCTFVFCGMELSTRFTAKLSFTPSGWSPIDAAARGGSQEPPRLLWEPRRRFPRDAVAHQNWILRSQDEGEFRSFGVRYVENEPGRVGGQMTISVVHARTSTKPGDGRREFSVNTLDEFGEALIALRNADRGPVDPIVTGRRGHPTESLKHPPSAAHRTDPRSSISNYS